jgi:hypothetical protein
MNKSLAFFGRDRLIAQLARLYSMRKHVYLVGEAGMGKTALLRQIRQRHSMLICEESSSLRRICDSLERQLGWTHHKLNVIERKNRLLAYLARRGEPVAFDHVGVTPPRVARYIGRVADAVPVWIACRSAQPDAIGHLWEECYRFEKKEIPPLTLTETQTLINEAIKTNNIQADTRRHIRELYRLSKGNPRFLEELLIELSARHYRMDSHGVDLLALDRKIHELETSIKAAAEQPA